MARSNYIYIICHNNPENPDPPHVIAAFTVKHEWQTWLEKCTHPHKSEFVTYRVHDNDWWDEDAEEMNTYKAKTTIVHADE